MIAHVRGRLASKSADRVVVETAGGSAMKSWCPWGSWSGYRQQARRSRSQPSSWVREDGWALYGFLDDSERRFFQRLTSISGVGPRIGIALLSALGVERGARALREKKHRVALVGQRHRPEDRRAPRTRAGRKS